MRNQQKRRKDKRYLNLSERPNNSIIQNFKNLKLFECSKYKKATTFGPKKFLIIIGYEKPTNH